MAVGGPQLVISKQYFAAAWPDTAGVCGFVERVSGFAVMRRHSGVCHLAALAADTHPLRLIRKPNLINRRILGPMPGATNTTPSRSDEQSFQKKLKGCWLLLLVTNTCAISDQ